MQLISQENFTKAKENYPLLDGASGQDTSVLIVLENGYGYCIVH